MDVRRGKLAASNPMRPSLDALAEAMMVQPAADGSLRVGGYTLTPTGLVGRAADRAEWDAIGDLLRRLEGGIQWMLADWLIEGEREYGQTYQMVAELTGYEVSTLHNLVYVAGKISLRSEKLTFGHHALVAALAEDDQRAWLEWAEENRASIAQMRKAMKGQAGDAGDTDPVGVTEVQKQAVKWAADVVKQLGKLERLDEKQRETLRQRANWLADYYRTIARKV